MIRRARIHELYCTPRSGEDIEALSFATIDREAPPHAFSPEEWEVVRRVIHTTGDFSVMESVRFSSDAIDAGISALSSGRPLYVDSNMIRSGLSLARLRAVYTGYGREMIHCHVADEDVARKAEGANLPRSILAVRKAKEVFKEGGLAVFGNAPTGLLEVNRMILEEGILPALVIAAPVGFVHVEESKEELSRLPVPSIILSGRRGGSPIAVAMVHALCTLASRKLPKPKSKEATPEPFDAVILLGHGSRVPGADNSMLQVAEALRETGRYVRVETCNMSRLGPHFEETFERSVRLGARKILVFPYFLNEGVHMKIDIPAMLKDAALRHRHVRLVFGKNLGFDPVLAKLVEKRIAESASLEDVIKILLPEEDAYPVPPGQCEFVPMPPEDARRWKKMNGQQSTSNNEE